MFRHHLRIAFRNLYKNKAHSFINIAGLSVGMAVSLLIGLWIWNQLSFDKYHDNYHRIAAVMERHTVNGVVKTGAAIALPLETAMRTTYEKDFTHIVMASWTDPHVLAAGDKKVSYSGNFMGSEGPEMLTLHMLRGTRDGLKGPSGILLSQSVATALFGQADPMDKLINLDNKAAFKVSGVYEDLPVNTTFHELAFIAPWDFYVATANWIGRSPTDWNDNSLMMYVQVARQADMGKVSEKIKDIKLSKAGPAIARFKPEIFLHPMRKWHLYSEFKNGINTGGAIQYVWLFGIIGMFVLLLACINFMNLSTARSERRAKEVGVRKTIGSGRWQLVGQFFAESFLMAALALAFSLILVVLLLPFFNEMADTNIVIAWSSPTFWLMTVGFALFTGLIAGSYPAFYLSSFRPVKVLKGTFRAGQSAATPRKVLVVLQFTVSVVLIIGTVIVFRQIQFAKDRPVGYSRDSLLFMEMATTDLHDHYDALRTDLLNSGAIKEIAESTSPTTGVNYNRSDVAWKGKDPAMAADFGNIVVSSTYGGTVGWQFTAGRDFSSQLHTDSAALILNETAVKYMGLKDPIGEIVKIGQRNYTVIGIIKDMVMGSPFESVKQTIFRLGSGPLDYINIKLNPDAGAHDALHKIEVICKVYSPSVPFSYKFVDEGYARKFSSEERVSRLASLFAALAIFISSLGLFGMASFMAEQRVKEIGVRKVLGASIFSLWKLLSREFMALILISILIAIPLTYYFMDNWLQHYQYRSAMSWWIFAAAAAGALLITLLTVSYQGIKAALMNPVKSLRSE